MSSRHRPPPAQKHVAFVNLFLSNTYLCKGSNYSNGKVAVGDISLKYSLETLKAAAHFLLVSILKLTT